MSCYCVLDIASGFTRYLGGFESKAADVLEPGTCYGTGAIEAVAIQQASEERRRFREMCPAYRRSNGEGRDEAR